MKVVVANASRNATAAIGMLVAAQQDLNLVGEAADLTELLVLVKANRPDVIVLDWDAFGSRIGELQQLLELFDTVPSLVALSVNDDLQHEARDTGVTRFAHKGSAPSMLLEAIRQTEPDTDIESPTRTIERDTP